MKAPNITLPIGDHIVLIFYKGNETVDVQAVVYDYNSAYQLAKSMEAAGWKYATRLWRHKERTYENDVSIFFSSQLEAK